MPSVAIAVNVRSQVLGQDKDPVSRYVRTRSPNLAPTSVKYVTASIIFFGILLRRNKANCIHLRTASNTKPPFLPSQYQNIGVVLASWEARRKLISVSRAGPVKDGSFRSLISDCPNRGGPLLVHSQKLCMDFLTILDTYLDTSSILVSQLLQ